MAKAPKPTNEQIVEMLQKVLDELDELRDSQKRLSDELAKISKAVK